MLLHRLTDQQAILAIHGFNPTGEDHIFETVKVDFVHTTARASGGQHALSLKETGLVLEEDATIPNKPLSDAEIIDIAAAFDLMVELVRDGERLSMR